ncbi:MAG: sigma-70 family RNA polymerase sigma factor [Bacteroidia bacterium]|nr:sigma-70 family RNA polymerase sigma factor [Bacteroidia bacterium]MCX7764258.1 sigma-70 family RNA polymerase sigma factor [Bacteroidia bacterium]MDW8057445.1 sigma-70 family RNA polymerase sigma factor [Bacteroidia bacterium]
MREEELWEQLQDEERSLAAFEVLVRLHYDRVKGWLRRWVRDEALAADLTQETFLQAWKNIHAFRGEAKFSSWLYAIARRLALRALRKQASMVALPWVWETLEDVELAEEASMQSVEEIEAALKAAEEKLSAAQRVVWQAVWREGLSYKAVAARLGIRENTVKAHIHQIRQRLRRFLGREE